MLFDFLGFSAMAESCYPGGPYSLGEMKEVFRYYFEKYEAVMGHPHPRIRQEQIEKCMRLMPWFSAGRSGPVDIRPGDYPAMIDRYFDTSFNGGQCDRNINHFFAGAIRKYRHGELPAVQQRQSRMNKYLKLRSGACIEL